MTGNNDIGELGEPQPWQEVLESVEQEAQRLLDEVEEIILR